MVFQKAHLLKPPPKDSHLGAFVDDLWVLSNRPVKMKAIRLQKDLHSDETHEGGEEEHYFYVANILRPDFPSGFHTLLLPQDYVELDAEFRDTELGQHVTLYDIENNATYTTQHPLTIDWRVTE